MAVLNQLLLSLGDEIEDVDEETFHLFSQNTSSSQDLGMVDAKAEEIDIFINGRDFAIKQSPGVLQSKREGGTTGAALWRACVLFAEWLGWNRNPLFTAGVLDHESTVMELGSGISGLVPLVLAPRMERVVATDQPYALKLLQENITANSPSAKPRQKNTGSNIDLLPLDWETSDIPSFLSSNSMKTGVDAVLVCDCVFNYALIRPLVQACVDVCKARTATETEDVIRRQTVCVIAQQLRQADVFEEWLSDFKTSFRVWSVPDEMLIDGLKEGRGYVVHIGVLL